MVRDHRPRGYKLLNHSVAALPPAKLFYSGNEVFLCEVRPQFRRDIHLGVRELPEKKIRQAHFSRSANKQIGIGIVAGVKMFAKHLDINHSFVDVTELNCAKQAFDAVDDLESPAVAQRQNKSESVITGGLFDRFVKLFLRALWKIGQTTDRLEPNILLHQLRHLFFQKLFKQTHQSEDFAFGTLPVFRRERVKGKILDFQIAAAFHAFTNGLGSCFVTFDARETPRFGPAAVAIHDNGDMARNDLGRGHDYRAIVSPRSGPTLIIDNFAPVISEMYLT